MKTKLCFIVLSVFMLGLSHAQNADLDRNYARFEYVNLPSHPIEDKNLRSYSIESNLDAIDKSKFSKDMTLVGFERKENADDATLNISLTVERINVEKVDVREVKHEKEEKDGKKETRYEYIPYISYSTRAKLDVNNKNGKGLSNIYGNSYQYYNGPSSYNYSKAKEYMNLNYQKIVQEIQDKFISETIGGSAYAVNNRYAYPTYKDNVNFWILGSKKNPEYNDHQNAFEQIKTLLSKIKAHEPIEELKSELEPIESYFLSVLPKYTDSKKRPHRKIRYATYYNLAQLYLIFDMPEKAIEMGNKIIENDYDTKDGIKFKEEAEKLIELMKVNQLRTRYFPIN